MNKKAIPLFAIKLVTMIALAVIIIEAGLRLDVLRQLSLQEIENHFHHRHGTYRILCVGDSLFSGTDERRSVPQHLEEILNSQAIGVQFNVINRSRPGQTSRRLVEGLESELDRYRPHMVVVLTGMDNDTALPENANTSFLGRSRLYQLCAAAYRGFKRNIAARTGSWTNNLMPLTRYVFDLSIGTHDIGIFPPRSPRTFSYHLSYILGIPATIINPLAPIYFLAPLNFHERTCFQSPVNPPALLSSIVTKTAVLTFDRGTDYIRQANIYMRQGKVLSAIEFFRLALHDNPCKANVYLDLSKVLAYNHREFEAKLLLERAVILFPVNTDIIWHLADLYEKNGDISKAVEAYYKVLALQPDNISSAHNIIRLYRDQYSSEKLNELVHDISRRKLSPSCSYFMTGIILSITGDFNLAESDLRKALEFNPHDAFSYAELIYLEAVKFRHYRDAIALLEKSYALCLTDKDSFALQYLGRRARALGDWPKAEAFFLGGMQLSPNLMRIYSDCADLYRKEGLFAKAEHLLKNALIRKPRNGLILRQMALLYRDKGDFEGAEEYFRKAVLYDPDDKEGEIAYKSFITSRAIVKQHLLNYAMLTDYVRTGQMFYSLQWYWQAERMFRKAILIAPNSPRAYIKLAKVLEAQTDFYAAKQLLKLAIVRCPPNADVYLALGTICHVTGDDSNAEQMFLSAVRLDPQNATAYKELAKFYIDTGNKRLEQQTIENALQFASKETLANFDLVSGSVKTNSHLPVLDSIDYHPTIIANFHTIKSILDKRNTRLVCVQYPLRNVQHLKNAFAGESGIIFVDNNDSFRNAIDHSSYDEYFLDRRKNNSGHGTDKGNRLMAENIATAILTEAFQHPLINNGNR